MRSTIASIVCATAALSACASPRPALAPRSVAIDTLGHRPTEAPGDLWAVLDPSVSPTDGAKSVAAFHDRLMGLTPDNILKIDREFRRELARSYSWELWGAAYIINGGCSDDCFDYFRGWLIMQGSAVFLAALHDPDSLAQYPHLSSDTELEDAVTVTRDAYRAATGKEPDGEAVTPVLGIRWDFDDHAAMRRRYPKLSQKFNW